MNPLHQARLYINRGLSNYGYDTAKHLSRVNLAIKNVDKAIYWTQVALFIHRIGRVS